MNDFLKGLADFLGEAGASFRSYSEQAKEEARRNANIVCANQINQKLDSAVKTYYPTIAEMLYEAIMSTVAATYLPKPWRKESLFSTPPAAINKHGLGFFIFQSYFSRRTLEANGITIKAVQRILQNSLDVETSTYGFPKLLLSVRFCGDGKILFGIAFQRDINAVRRIFNAAG